MIKGFSQFWHLLRISWVLARHRFDQVILDAPIFRSVRFMRYVNPWNWRSIQGTRGAHIRRALEELGPIFVKFGQMLSTRRDLLPDDIALELALLQDRVPAFDGHLAQQIIESEFQQPLSALLAEFDIQPLAAASIAQVHTAKLWDGRKVVVKVLRPGIAKIIRRDVELLYSIARLMEKYWADGRRLKPIEVVAEFERTIFDELDLQREAANASQLRRNFLLSPLLYVPEVHWPYVRSRVLVLEQITGIPVADRTLLLEHGVNLKLLAERGVEIFFTQVFRDCFFHADMHPGNIFVSFEHPHNPQYIAVDFGIMGTLSPTDQRYLAENMLAFFKRDYRRAAQLHIDSGWVPVDTRVDVFESAIRTVCEPAFERPLREISFGQMLLRLFQTARQFNMEVQPQLMLLQKTLLNIEGLGRELYPELDLWATAKPFLERWLRQQVGPKALWRKIRDNSPYWAEKLPEIPDMLYQILRQRKDEALIKQNRRETLAAEPKPENLMATSNFWSGVIVGVGMAAIFYAAFQVGHLLPLAWL